MNVSLYLPLWPVNVSQNKPMTDFLKILPNDPTYWSDAHTEDEKDAAEIEETNQAANNFLSKKTKKNNNLIRPTTAFNIAFL